MASNGGDNQHQSSDNNQHEYQQNQRRRLNVYPLHAYDHQTSFNDDIMGYLSSGSNGKNLTQEQAHYGEVHLQTKYKNSVTEVGESSNRFIVNQQVEESPIGLSLSNLTSLVNQSQLGLTQPSNRQKRKKEFIASEESKLKAASFFASSIQIGYWVKESKNEGDVVVKFYYGKKKLVWEFLYGCLKKKMEIRWSQVSAIMTFDDEHQNGYIALELSEPPELSEEVNFTAKKHTKWQTTRDDFTGGQASIYRRHTVKCPPGVLNKPISDLLSRNSYLHSLSQQPFPRHSPLFNNLNQVYSANQCLYASASIPVSNHGNHQGEFIDYVPNVVQPSGSFEGIVYPHIPSPALNQIATKGSYETPGTNGVIPPALNQTATRVSYENPRENGLDTPALNQIATRESYEYPRTNGVTPPALNQTATRVSYENPRANGLDTPGLNQIATRESYEYPRTNGVTPPALNQTATRVSYENPRANGLDTPALNQIATRESYEYPRTNGVIPPTLNQIARSDLYENPRTNGVYTPALNQIATRDFYEAPGKNNGVIPPALNQIETSDSYEIPGTNGVYTPALNQIATRDDRDLQSLIMDLETEILPDYTNIQTLLNDNQTNKPYNQSDLMNLNTEHQSFEDNSKLPVGVVIPMVDSSFGGSQATDNLECLDEHDITLLQSLMNMDDLRNSVDAENGNDFEDAFKTFDRQE